MFEIWISKGYSNFKGKEQNIRRSIPLIVSFKGEGHLNFKDFKGPFLEERDNGY